MSGLPHRSTLDGAMMPPPAPSSSAASSSSTAPHSQASTGQAFLHRNNSHPRTAEAPHSAAQPWPAPNFGWPGGDVGQIALSAADFAPTGLVAPALPLGDAYGALLGPLPFPPASLPFLPSGVVADPSTASDMQAANMAGTAASASAFMHAGPSMGGHIDAYHVLGPAASAFRGPPPGHPPDASPPGSQWQGDQSFASNAGTSVGGDDEDDGEDDSDMDDSYYANGGFGDVSTSTESSMQQNGDVDDAAMQERLAVVKQVQEAASAEGSDGIFACPYCDKRYGGKHARSIWRRHLQDKHHIPLSQQPRRTRWDGDANRPKNAEERRQRMLESKRRWARKKRMMERAGIEGTPASLEAHEKRQREAMAGSFAQMAEGSASRGPSQVGRHDYVDGMPRMGGPDPFPPPGADFRRSRPLPQSFDDAFSAGPTPSVRPDAPRSKGMSFMGPVRFAPPHTFPPPQPQPPPTSKAQDYPHVSTHVMMNTAPPARRALSTIDANTGAPPPTDSHSSDRGSSDDSKETKTPLSRLSDLPPLQAPLSNETARTTPGVAPTAAFYKATSADPVLLPSPSRVLGSSPMRPMLARRTKQLGYSPGVGPERSNVLRLGDAPPSAGRRAGPNPFSLDQHKLSPSHAIKALPPMGRESDVESPARMLGVSRNLPPLVGTPLRPSTLGEAESGGLGVSLGGGGGSMLRRPPLSRKHSRDEEATVDDAGGSVSSAAGRSLLGVGLAASLTPFRRLPGSTPLGKGGMVRLTPARGGVRPSTAEGLREDVGLAATGGAQPDQFSSPQHLNLTTSLGLAPSSVGRSSGGSGGAFGYGVGATPYVGGTAAFGYGGVSPWPDSAIRPSRLGGASQSKHHDMRRGSGAAEGDEDEEEDEEALGGLSTRFLNETPSRPSGSASQTSAACSASLLHSVASGRSSSSTAATTAAANQLLSGTSGSSIARSYATTGVRDGRASSRGGLTPPSPGPHAHRRAASAVSPHAGSPSSRRYGGGAGGGGGGGGMTGRTPAKSLVDGERPAHGVVGDGGGDDYDGGGRASLLLLASSPETAEAQLHPHGDDDGGGGREERNDSRSPAAAAAASTMMPQPSARRRLFEGVLACGGGTGNGGSGERRHGAISPLSSSRSPGGGGVASAAAASAAAKRRRGSRTRSASPNKARRDGGGGGLGDDGTAPAPPAKEGTKAASAEQGQSGQENVAPPSSEPRATSSSP